MSADDEVSCRDEKSSYGLMGRTMLFLIITGPGTVIALGLWIRMGAGVSLSAALGKGNWSLLLIFFLWLIGIVGGAIAIFKK